MIRRAPARHLRVGWPLWAPIASASYGEWCYDDSACSCTPQRPCQSMSRKRAWHRSPPAGQCPACGHAAPWPHDLRRPTGISAIGLYRACRGTPNHRNPTRRSLRRRVGPRTLNSKKGVRKYADAAVMPPHPEVSTCNDVRTCLWHVSLSLLPILPQ